MASPVRRVIPMKTSLFQLMKVQLILTALFTTSAFALLNPVIPTFGPRAGNFQPRRNISETVTRRDTGEWVSMPKLAYWTNANIQDGAGNGTDSYTMYTGNGEVSAGWPDKSSWVSFQNM